MSRTAKAEEVREYFLKIEAHLDKYKNHIINAMNKKIEKYEKELKPQPEIKTEGVIYVLKTNEDIEGVYKIGRTRDFQARIKTHQSSHPNKLEIAYVYETENIEYVEKCLKDLLKEKAYRKRKEFYEIDPDILKQLITLCDCLHLTDAKKCIKCINTFYTYYKGMASLPKYFFILNVLVIYFLHHLYHVLFLICN
jgi:predicted GIY-YIG superfamily endonuclease